MTVVRDRGQWAMDIAATPTGEAHGLDVLLRAMTGAAPAPGPLDAGPALPDGVGWSKQVPELIRWLESGDRSAPSEADEERR